MFPKDQPRRRCWINKVLTTRANWTASEHSMLCSRHFGEDCFEPEVAIAASLGINRKKKLKPTAVPSLFEKQPSTFESASGQTSRKRMARTDDAAGVIESTAKKPRTAYEKHERLRVSDHDSIGFIACMLLGCIIHSSQIVQEVLAAQPSSSSATTSTCTTEEDSGNQSLANTNIGTQVNIKVSKVNTRIQVKPRMKSTGLFHSFANCTCMALTHTYTII